MAHTQRSLFPDLPPELRHEIYNYLSLPNPTHPATTSSLPLKLKTFSCRHTTVQLCPIHYGSTGLLALQNYHYLESHEYAPWLLQNGLELRIGIVFKGRINTFVHADWAKKMEAHLRKLAKMFPWLRKVARYDVQILWDPADGVLRSSKRRVRRTAGLVVGEMLKTLVGVMDGDVKRRKGDVRVALRIEHRVVVEGLLAGVEFGVEDFRKAGKELGVRTGRMEVWKGECKKVVEEKVEGRLIPAPAAEKVEEKNMMIVVEAGRVMWVQRPMTRLSIS